MLDPDMFLSLSPYFLKNFLPKNNKNGVKSN